jgi:signal transduction histidine kinase
MTFHAWLTLVACVGELALALVAALRGSRSPLALPLALLSLALFGWNFANLAFLLSGNPAWRWLDVAVSPLGTPFALHFLLGFAGRTRELRSPLIGCYAYYGALSLASLSAFALPAAQRFAGSPLWAMLFLAGLVPTTLLAGGALFVHLRRASTAEEQARTKLLIASLALAVALNATELLADVGLDIPRLGALGALTCTALLTTVTFRFDLFERRLSTAHALYAASLGSLAVAAYVALFWVLRTNLALLAIAVLTLTLAIVFISRRAVTLQSARRARLQYLATLGRFSAQMAHDLKNPLAALKGAAQLLREDQLQGKPLAERVKYLDLMLGQIDRLHRVLDDYQRLGRADPRREPVDVNLLAHAIAKERVPDGPASVEVRTELDPALPSCSIDREMIGYALENLVRNAVEAMPTGGTLSVRTAKASLASGPAVRLEVQDTGQGMDARTKERAFDDFFTTKAQGSGLGLAFVKRVAEAHGGEVALTSQEGRGTVVALVLPLDGQVHPS